MMKRLDPCDQPLFASCMNMNWNWARQSRRIAVFRGCGKSCDGEGLRSYHVNRRPETPEVLQDHRLCDRRVHQKVGSL